MKAHKQKNIDFCGLGRVKNNNLYKTNPISFWFPIQTYSGIRVRYDSDTNAENSIKDSDKRVNEILKFNLYYKEK